MFYITSIIGSVLLLLAMGIFQHHRPFLDREIMKDVTLTSEWLEITLEQSLKPEREVQMIALKLEDPYIADLEREGVSIPDGSLILPDVQLVDQYGNVFDLKYGGLRGRKIIYFSNFNQLPKDRNYRTVRIRSEKPISCEKILWSCFNWKDID